MILLDKVKPCEAIFTDSTTLLTVVSVGLIVIALCTFFIVRYRKSKQ
ncbi:MAG: hypothetical protein J6Y24_13655 [Bacteroidales bacterium]|nr:hypothetical protein [Bacteroidales bacterium]